SRFRSVLRIVAGFTFALHGWQKAFGALGGIGGQSVPITSMLGAAGWIETVGSALIMLGLFTRPVAFILSAQMAVAYFPPHPPPSFGPLSTGGDTPALCCFFWLWLWAGGGGVGSLGGRWGRKG